MRACVRAVTLVAGVSPPRPVPYRPIRCVHAVEAGCEGVAAINTLSCVMGVNLDTLRPEPAVEGYSTQGGYSYRAVKPIALAKVSSQAF